jgi:hypothetical protein
MMSLQPQQDQTTTSPGQHPAEHHDWAEFSKAKGEDALGIADS